jgi:hypothetical protein
MTDWSKVVYRNFESKELDYKAPCAWDENNKKACCEFVKDILALANTSGGWLVIGVSEGANGFVHSGLSEEQAKSFDASRVNRFVQNYADPPINARIHKVVSDSRSFVVVEVPAFPDTPHVCQKEYPGVLAANAIYVRTDNNESAPLKSSADFRSIVEKAVRNRSDQLLVSFRTILTSGVQTSQPSDAQKYEQQIASATKRCQELNPHKNKSYAYRQTAFYPSRFQKDRFDLAELRKMAKNACVDFRGWPFIFIHDSRPDFTGVIEDGLETFIAEKHPFNGGDTLHFWQLRQSGLLCAKEILWEETLASAKRPSVKFDFGGLATNAAEAVHCLVKLYEDQLDESDNVVLRFQIVGVEGRSVDSLQPGRRFLGQYTCRIPEITFEQERPLAEWKAGMMDHAIEICRYVFQRFNWETPALGECRKIMENLFARRL